MILLHVGLATVRRVGQIDKLENNPGVALHGHSELYIAWTAESGIRRGQDVHSPVHPQSPVTLGNHSTYITLRQMICYRLLFILLLSREKRIISKPDLSVYVVVGW